MTENNQSGNGPLKLMCGIDMQDQECHRIEIKFDEDYFEGGNRRYAVWGGQDPGSSYAMYYLLQDPHRGTPNMELNLQELLKHAMRVTGDRIPANYDLIEVAIAAEGHPVADGKFRANIITMGRP